MNFILIPKRQATIRLNTIALYIKNMNLNHLNII